MDSDIIQRFVEELMSDQKLRQMLQEKIYTPILKQLFKDMCPYLYLCAGFAVVLFLMIIVLLIVMLFCL